MLKIANERELEDCLEVIPEVLKQRLLDGFKNERECCPEPEFESESYFLIVKDPADMSALEENGISATSFTEEMFEWQEELEVDGTKYKYFCFVVNNEMAIYLYLPTLIYNQWLEREVR